MSIDILDMITMVEKIQQLVESFPEYQHGFYIPNIECYEKVKALGYTRLKDLSSLLKFSNLFYKTILSLIVSILIEWSKYCLIKQVL